MHKDVITLKILYVTHSHKKYFPLLNCLSKTERVAQRGFSKVVIINWNLHEMNGFNHDDMAPG